MGIFTETCDGLEYKDNEFFKEWHKAIKRDLEVFKIILEQYEESKDKDNLLRSIIFIQKNILNNYEDDNEALLKNTPNYFLFSFYFDNSDMPIYVLLSKDYKKILIGYEVMECFDDKEFDEDERYGIYHYDYYILDNNNVNHYHKEKKEYTQDYTGKFASYLYDKNIKQVECYYDFLLNQFKSDKKIVKKLGDNQ